ncbi:MAG: hypothetical protein ACREB9_03905, partial [Thermoplasmata archaeon]
MSPTPIPVDDKIAKMIEAEAKARNISPGAYLAAMLTAKGEQDAAPLREFAGSRESLPPRRKSAQERFEEMNEQIAQSNMNRLMMSGMGGGGFGGSPGDLAAAIAQAVDKRLDERMPRRRHDDGDVFARTEEMLENQVRLKSLKTLAGDDSAANRAYEDRMKELDRKLEELSKKNSELHEEAAAAREESRAAEQKRTAEDTLTRIEALQQTISYQQSQIANLQKGPGKPEGDAFDQWAEMNDKLESFKRRVGATGTAKPDLVDQIDRIAERVTTHFASAGETAAKLIAAQRGIPPGEYASEPEPPITATSPEAPALAQQEIAKLRDTVAAMRNDGFRCDPSDYTTWPDIRYAATVNGRQTELSRQAWVQT